MRNVSVDLNANEAGLVDRLLAEKRFSDDAAILHYALLLLQDWSGEHDEADRELAETYSREEMKQLWDEGMASGPPLDGNFNLDEIRTRGLAELAAMRKAQARAA